MLSGKLRLELESVVLKFDHPKKDLIVVYALVWWLGCLQAQDSFKQSN